MTSHTRMRAMSIGLKQEGDELRGGTFGTHPRARRLSMPKAT
jgi:hypothetical protein